MSGADDVSMLGLGIDASSAPAGASVYGRSIDDIKRKSEEGTGAVGRMSASFGGFHESIREAAGTIAAFVGVHELVKYADEWANINNELRQVTGSASELASVEAQLFKVAQESRGGLESTVAEYKRYAEASSEAGLNTQQLLGITRTVNESLALSGVSADEAAGAVNALSRSFATGTVQGRVILTLLNQAPTLARALADGLGLTIPQFQAMASAGDFSTKAIAQALENSAAKVHEEYGGLTLTVGAAFTQLKNSALQYVGAADQANGASGSLAGIIHTLAENINVLGTAAEVMALAWVGKVITPMIASTIGFMATQGQAIGINRLWQEAIAQDAAFEAERAATAVESAQVQLAASTAMLASYERRVASAVALNAVTAETLTLQGFLAGAETEVAAATIGVATASDTAAAAQVRMGAAEEALSIQSAAAGTAMSIFTSAIFRQILVIGVLFGIYEKLKGSLKELGEIKPSDGQAVRPADIAVADSAAKHYGLVADSLGHVTFQAMNAKDAIASLGSATADATNHMVGFVAKDDEGTLALNRQLASAQALYHAVVTGGMAAYKAEEIHQKVLKEGEAAWDKYEKTQNKAAGQQQTFADALAAGNPKALEFVSTLSKMENVLDKTAQATEGLKGAMDRMKMSNEYMDLAANDTKAFQEQLAIYKELGPYTVALGLNTAELTRRLEDAALAHKEQNEIISQTKELHGQLAQMVTEGIHAQYDAERQLLATKRAYEDQAIAIDRAAEAYANYKRLHDGLKVDKNYGVPDVPGSSGGGPAGQFDAAGRALSESFTQVFENLFGTGNGESLGTTFAKGLSKSMATILGDGLKKMFVTQIALFEDGVKNGWGGVTELLGSKLAGAIAGAISGAVVGYQSGDPLKGALGGATAGFEMGGPVGAVLGGVAGLVGGLFGQAEKFRQLNEVYHQNIDKFNDNLHDFIDNLGVAAGSVQAQLNEAKKTGSSFNDQAFGLAAGSPGLAGQGIKITAEQLSDIFAKEGQAGLDKFRSYAEAWAHYTGQSVLAVDETFDRLQDALNLTGDAAKAAAAKIKTDFIDRIQTELTASLPGVGSELSTLSGFMKQFTDDMAGANTLGVDTKPIMDTLTNNVNNFFGGLTTAALDTLIASGQLSPSMLALAQAIDVSKHAADAAAQAEADRATNLTLAGRIAQATGLQADEDAYRHAQQQAEYDKAVADHAGPATLELIKYTQALEETKVASDRAAVAAQKQADEDQKKADAAAKAAQDMAAAALTSQNFQIDLLQKQAAISDDLEMKKLYNLAALKIQQEQQLDAAGKLLDAGTITEEMYVAFAGVLANQMDNAIHNTTDGINDMATAAQILTANVSSLNQEFDVMGTGLHDQIKSLEAIYGFGNASLDQLRDMFQLTAVGQQLSPEQAALNDHIQQVVDLMYRAQAEDDAAAQKADAAAAKTTASTGSNSATLAPAGSVAYGPTTSVLAPGGVVNLNVNVQVTKEQVDAGGFALGLDIARGIDTGLGRALNLAGDALGRQ